jgi:cytochrome c-type biogenesis protein CcmH
MRQVIASLLIVLVVGSFLSATVSAQTQGPPQARVRSDAQALAERLHAPCCHEQLLDGHDSAPAKALKEEIRARLAQGASPDEVEQELVRRYGSWIVAVPKDRDPRAGLSIALVLGLSGTAIGLTLLGLRWVRSSRQAAEQLPSTGRAHATGPACAEQLDARLEAELRRMDDD